jgi:hypothetical protein
MALRTAGTAIVLCLCACGAPPSVTPLLRVSRDALLQEAQRQSVDLQREQMHIEQNRAALRSAFAADLAGRQQLDPAWVSDAAEMYAAAQAALANESARREAERLARADNLRAAAEAQSRAIALIEKQDAMLSDVIAVDTWLARLLLGSSTSTGDNVHE